MLTLPFQLQWFYVILLLTVPIVRLAPLMATPDLSPETFKGFEYSVLPDNLFRLLRITNVDVPLRCEIQDFARNEAPEYCALSYVWGTGEKKERIVCNERTIHISTNLFLALYEIGTRREFENTCVWIDAICINQKTMPKRTYKLETWVPSILRRPKLSYGWAQPKMTAILPWTVLMVWGRYLPQR